MINLLKIFSLFLLSISFGAYASPKPNNQSPTSHPAGIYLLHANENNFIFLDEPLLIEKDPSGTPHFFYHEIRKANPSVVMIVLSQANCDEKRLRSKSMWEYDTDKAELVRQINALPNSSWTTPKTDTLDIEVLNSICDPSSRKDESKIMGVKITGATELFQEKYIGK